MGETDMSRREAIRVMSGFILTVMLMAGAIALLAVITRGRPDELETDGEPVRTVVIDAGHGGMDGGAVAPDGTPEKEINLEIAKLLEAMLRANGIATVMTRNEDILLYDRNADYQGHKKMLDLAARRRTAEETEHAVFVSIHMNYFPEPQYRGLQVFYSARHPNSEILAEQIQCTASAYWQSNNKRQTKPATSAIYLLDRLTCPAVLVECGFLSNPEEAALFSQADYKQEAAFTIFSALMSYISESNA